MQCATQTEVSTEQLQLQSPQLGPSGIQNVYNKTPERSASVVSVTTGKALDLDSPIPIVTPPAKRIPRQDERKERQETTSRKKIIKAF